MTRHGVLVAACVLLLAAACDNTPTTPEGTVVGSFGGEGILLTAERTRVALFLRCNTVLTDKPLVPDRDGRFTLAATWQKFTPAVLRGNLSGPAINVEVIVVTSDTIFRQQYTAVRDQPGDIFAICAL
jgi:hypothetical protein